MRTYLILTLSALLLVGCGDKDAAEEATETPPPTPAVVNTPPPAKAVPEFDGEILSGKHTVVLKTSKGDITVELDADAAPKTVTNFVTLAKGSYYDDLIFHRVIPDFMIQGGDPNGNGTGGESVFGGTFEDEINPESYGLHEKKLSEVSGDQPLPDQLKDATIQEYYELQGYVYNADLTSLPMARGALAMANRGPNTNGSQFFIVHADETPWLEGKHTVFGNVTDGMDIVDAIATVQRDARDKPAEDITYTVEVQ